MTATILRFPARPRLMPPALIGPRVALTVNGLANHPGYYSTPRAQWVAEQAAIAEGREFQRDAITLAEQQDVEAEPRALPVQVYEAHPRPAAPVAGGSFPPPPRGMMGSVVAILLGVLLLIVALVIGVLVWELLKGLPTRTAITVFSAEALACGAC